MRLEEINLRNPVSVGFYDPFSVFPLIRNEFLSKFPLSNLHWKFHPLKPVKSIALLPVTFTEEVPREKAENNAVYLRVMFVHAETLDTYRAQVRPLIKAWLEKLVHGKRVSWVIVQVVPDTLRDRNSTIIKTSVFDKLRADFGKSGKLVSEIADEDPENVLKVRQLYKADLQRLEAYNEVLITFKHYLLQTFTQKQQYFDELLLKHRKTRDGKSAFKEVLVLLQLAELLNDMKLFKESLEVQEAVEEQLRELARDEPGAFTHDALVLDANLNEYLPETHHQNVGAVDLLRLYIDQDVRIDHFLLSLCLFVSSSLLLQSLGNFATTISISAIYILRLLLRLAVLLNEALAPFGDSLAQWLCAVIDYYLNLPITLKLTELDEMALDNGSSLAAVAEYSGELKLIKRTILGRMAAKQGFGLPVITSMLDEILLDSEPKREAEVSYAPIKGALASQEAFESYFEELTLSLIQDFVTCQRTKTVDLLSVDLAVLHFKKEQYTEALEILSQLYEYFLECGWNFMGGAMLDVYLTCLEKAQAQEKNQEKSTQHLLATSLKLFYTLKSYPTVETGINSYSRVSLKMKRQRVFERISQLADKLTKELTFNLEDLFAVDIKRYIQPGPLDSYYIEVSVKNPYKMEIPIAEMAVTIEDAGFPVIFTAQNLAIPPDESVVKLYTRTFKSGYFSVSETVVTVSEKLKFVKAAQQTQDPNRTVIHMDSTIVNLPETAVEEDIYMYEHPEHLRVSFSNSLPIKLGASAFDVAILLAQKVSDVSVAVRCKTSGVTLTGDPHASVACIEGQHSLTQTYTYYGEKKVLELEATVSYEKQGERYTHHALQTLDVSLTISISVQDFFREALIVSKFQIGTARVKCPVRVLDWSLECQDEKYLVETLATDVFRSKELILFGEQPAFLFYKITPKGRVLSSDSLDLTLTYLSLEDECHGIVLAQLLALLNADLGQYQFLVSAFVLQLSFDLTHFATTLCVRITNQDECVARLETQLQKHVFQETVRALLKETFADCLAQAQAQPAQKHHENKLYIPVAIPALQMVHTVEFVFEKKAEYLVGEPIGATLRILSLSKWQNQPLPEALASLSPRKAESQEFHFTVQNEESWLISGFKKRAFHVTGENQSLDFAVTMVPLAVGMIPVPKVEIKLLAEALMDVVHENGLEALLVVPKIHSITFSF